ncbi:hypothetical protein H8959_006036 [Pygathrix nigripes]
MELAREARELSCWAAEEMGVPVAARARESTLRRLCLGQGADIWAYILQHVHSQRTVKKIRGNLLWYGHQDSPQVRRKLGAGSYCDPPAGRNPRARPEPGADGARH